LNGPTGVALTGTTLVFTEQGTYPLHYDGRILSCPVTGCPGGSNPTVIATNEKAPSFVAAQDGVVYWAGLGGGPNGGDGQVKSCTLTGCVAPTLLADHQSLVGDLVIDAKNVYWTSYGGGSNGVYSCALAGCNDKPTLVAADDDPRGLAIDAVALYFTSYQKSLVKKVAK
jgi:hypothetical protein